MTSFFRPMWQAAQRRRWYARSKAALSVPSAAERPRLYVDLSTLLQHDAGTGIQRVVRAVWSELRKRSGAEFDAIPVRATRERGYEIAAAALGSALEAGAPVSLAAGDCFLGLDLSANLLPLHRQQLKQWRSAGATIAIVVYDLLPLEHPEWFTPRAARSFRGWLAVVEQLADVAFCISDAVRGSLRQRLGESGHRLSVRRLQVSGAMEDSCPSKGISSEVERALVRLQGLNFLLMVGTVEPRKGHDCALSAFDRLWSASPDTAPYLVIVGQPGWRTKRLQRRLLNHHQSGKRLFWLRNVSDEGLALLYKACSGVLVASHAEGFGLPAVEAALHRRHALVRDLPVFREQNLANLSYFSKDDPASLSAAVTDFLERSVEPPPQAVCPSWHDCVTSLLVDLGLDGCAASTTPHRSWSIPA